MLFDYLVAIVAQKLKHLNNFNDNINRRIFEKTWIFEKIFNFSIVFKFQGDLQERGFELRLQPGSQKASKLLK